MDKDNVKVWIVIYFYNCKIDIIPFFRDKAPSEKDIINNLEDYNSQYHGYFEIRGPYYQKGCP